MADRPAQPYVGITAPVTMSSIAVVADRIPELFAHLAAHGAPPAGAPFLRYHRIDMESELIVEAGVPVATAVPGAGDIRPGTLPAGRYATVLHTGHPDELVAVTGHLLDWAKRQDLEFDCRPTPEGEVWGCRLETYLTDPREVPDLHRWQTELAFRLAG
ncbi:GyrI-like domain-containing protein [Pseudonocardia sp. CA-107938]|uniref:GyrI-like domain-containing protein n=1 Tax=Pseudonocardia sp. CA-107938 TaxID=3240021 RepID=UPI003D8C79DF